VQYLNRKQATTYLRERGIPCGDNFLAHQAVDGTGPEFRYSGKHPVYTEAALDEWIEARLSAPVRSPSEAPKRPGRPRQKESAQAEPDAA
jgi:hypothetical protein